jgi:hypothetical protein
MTTYSSLSYAALVLNKLLQYVYISLLSATLGDAIRIIDPLTSSINLRSDLGYLIDSINMRTRALISEAPRRHKRPIWRRLKVSISVEQKECCAGATGFIVARNDYPLHLRVLALT